MSHSQKLILTTAAILMIGVPFAMAAIVAASVISL
jgi:hypothetical protein